MLRESALQLGAYGEPTHGLGSDITFPLGMGGALHVHYVGAYDLLNSHPPKKYCPSQTPFLTSCQWGPPAMVSWGGCHVTTEEAPPLCFTLVFQVFLHDNTNINVIDYCKQHEKAPLMCNHNPFKAIHGWARKLFTGPQ